MATDNEVRLTIEVTGTQEKPEQVRVVGVFPGVGEIDDTYTEENTHPAMYVMIFETLSNVMGICSYEDARRKAELSPDGAVSE